MGPDQVSSVLSKAAKWRAAAGSRGYGRTRKTKCHNAAATTARRGIFLSIQQSLKKPVGKNFLGTGVLLRRVATQLAVPWWKLPQAMSSFGPQPAVRRTGSADLVACPAKSNALLVACPRDMSL